MIELYVKSGIMRKKPVVAFVLRSSKHQWLKTLQLKGNWTQKQIESFGCLLAIKHIKPKWLKDVILYTDSEYLLDILAVDEENRFIRENTSVDMSKHLRSLIIDTGCISIHEMPCDAYYEELDHVFQECAFDDIELNEKD